MKHTNSQQARIRTPLVGREDIDRNLLARAQCRGALTAIIIVVAQINLAIGAGVASTGLVMKGVGTLGNTGKSC